ncbi:hypothetical protein BD324DRAFT_576880 [Kockovaella imperatae]|uniref:UAS domain-containing protein n=1 Tax=Kockovaella imperatae TaxID=4999 RepID=A0A1Y1UMC2_9TREE|nr:hypothetical protein BD324DRAFT_576880 [Kockovaella imperatae]ORX39203.1 hypothetical protein BD324DRAFT_576880 [Kockovaella imperatae]
MSLSASQQDALEQLWAVTDSQSAPSRERDERLLRENGWDVQRTVELIFASADDQGSSAGPSRPSPPTYEPMEVDDSMAYPDLQPRSRRRPASRSLSGSGTSGVGLWGFITFPIRLVWSVFTGTWYFFIRTFIPLSFLPHFPRALLPPARPTGSTTHRALDPTAESLAFIRDLEVYTGASAANRTLPDFYAGPYREFLSQVRKQGKVGLVVLMCGEHEDDEEFKRDVLIDSDLVRTLKDKDIMVWAADIRSREGYQVSQTLLVTTYPSLTYVSLLPASPTSNSTASPRLSVLSTLSGPPSTTTSASSIVQTLTNSILPRTGPFLARLKRERLTLEEARHLREEQDRAFKAAERKDRERLQAQRQAEQAERLTKEREARELAEKASQVEKRRQWRRYARKHLLPRSEGSIRVALRTPISSERVIRQFQPGPSTMPLFILAETLLIPPSDVPEEDPESPPEGYEPSFDFRIVTAYPRKEIERVEEGGEAIWNNVTAAGGALFAEKLDGGNWGDEEVKALNGEDSEDEEVIE